MKYMLLVYFEENGDRRKEREDCYQESIQLTHDLDAEGAISGRRAAPPDIDGHQRSGARRQAAGDRRSVCGDPGAPRRLLSGRGARSRRGDRHCRADSRSAAGERSKSAP